MRFTHIRLLSRAADGSVRILNPCPVMVGNTLPAGIRPARPTGSTQPGCGTGRFDEHPFGAGDQFVGFHDGLIGDLVNPT